MNEFTITLSDIDVERLRNLGRIIADRADGLPLNRVTLTTYEHKLIARITSQLPPEPIEDGIYTRVHNLSVSTVFVKDNMWSTHIEPQDGSLVLAERVGPEAAEWTRVADLPDVNEWL